MLMLKAEKKSLFYYTQAPLLVRPAPDVNKHKNMG